MNPDEFEKAEYERHARNKFAIDSALTYLRVIEMKYADRETKKIVADLRSILDWSNR